MEHYQRTKEIGRGSYGVVWRARNIVTGELVAVKNLFSKYKSVEECRNMKEVKALLKMNHPNIVKLKGVFKTNNILYLVFENMECSLHQRMSGKPFSEEEIKNLCFQVFQGLAHMHGNGYFHRDLKPENLLVSEDVIKIDDLGQARETNGKPPYTDYITTRWYRAPEVLLFSSEYDPAVDMWAMGAIMAELYTRQPLFGGDSFGEVLHKICSVIGSPTESKWSKGIELARDINFQFPDLPFTPLAKLLPSASHKALCLIDTLLSWNPCSRPTAMEALDHPFFDSCRPPIHLNQDLPWKLPVLLKPRRVVQLV